MSDGRNPLLVPDAWLAWIPVLTRLLGLLGALWEIVIVDALGIDRSWQAIALIGAMLGLGEFVQVFAPRASLNAKNGRSDT